MYRGQWMRGILLFFLGLPLYGTNLFTVSTHVELLTPPAVIGQDTCNNSGPTNQTCHSLVSFNNQSVQLDGFSGFGLGIVGASVTTSTSLSASYVLSGRATFDADITIVG